MVALPLARAVGRGGRVVGLDLSRGMLAVAAAKAAAEGLLAPGGPLELVEQDADAASFPHGSLDAITCSAALPFLTDTPRTLATWHSWLRPGGAGSSSRSSSSSSSSTSGCSCSSSSSSRGAGAGGGAGGGDGGLLAFNAFAAPNSPEFGIFLRLLADRHGIEVEDPCERLGSEERCAAAMAAAGFVDVQVVREEFDDTRPRSLEAFVDSWWRQCACSPFAPLDALLSPEQVEALRAEWVVLATASAAQRLVGGSVVNRPVTFVVTGRRP
ncbi:hypothetical protein HYH02_005781 [Chlamydomonas schloesseri]|uniref:Methyltransferase domain-containing protein n=1 Tax=Chlamydomonas schloesseri TaxID=2026947 RepID=A0A835WKP4_9CHLO|nr:hypothetical protein HYH02_005781 [Chlamydomonas schloesseri]|eukprot:KAG2449029.1 hypothetical protein HYH02_005781 [Chlamydomonas schloesseri]